MSTGNNSVNRSNHTSKKNFLIYVNNSTFVNMLTDYFILLLKVHLCCKIWRKGVSKKQRDIFMPREGLRLMSIGKKTDAVALWNYL